MKKIKMLLTLISGAGLLLPLLAMNQAAPQSEKDFSNTALLLK